jgi:hypothetical protein
VLLDTSLSRIPRLLLDNSLERNYCEPRACPPATRLGRANGLLSTKMSRHWLPMMSLRGRPRDHLRDGMLKRPGELADGSVMATATLLPEEEPRHLLRLGDSVLFLFLHFLCLSRGTANPTSAARKRGGCLVFRVFRGAGEREARWVRGTLCNKTVRDSSSSRLRMQIAKSARVNYRIESRADSDQDKDAWQRRG